MRIKVGITIWLFFVIGVAIFMGLALSYFISDYFKQTILQRAVDVNAKFIALQANQHLHADDFIPDNYDKKVIVFSNFFNEIDTGEIVRIKVWSTDETVVYSDDKEIIGETFHDNEELDDALAGDVEYEISDLEASENVSEKSYDNLMEIYIPIKSDSNQVVGVIETYTSMEAINTYIENANTIIFLISLIGITAVTLIVIFTFNAFKKNVIKPIIDIHKNAKEIENGNLEIKSKPLGYDELQNLTNEIEIMASRLKESKEKIIKAERLSAIGELASRFAHDLRNPLQVIRLSLSILKEKYGSNSVISKDFARIERSIQRMSHQIEGVMDFIGTKPLQLQTISVGEIIRSVIKNDSIPDSVKISYPPNDITIDCDREKLEVVFENIFLNARQAMNDAGTINIKLEENNGWVRLEIKDSGPGIPEEVLPKIFDPLFTTKQEGTGLGLSSVKNIIEQHNGTVHVKTETGLGTTFVLSLPIKSQYTINFPKQAQIISAEKYI